MKKFYLTLATLTTGLNSFAQKEFKIPKATDVEGKIREEGAGWINIVNYILGFMCFAGLIYVIAGLLGKREMSKGIVISWVLCLIIWGLGNAILF